ncbi:MAG: hypothetical protein GXO77_16645 [Calditrichaeota bacterium]|nr:hypothetical protein [Calditrichota bacterium]
MTKPTEVIDEYPLSAIHQNIDFSNRFRLEYIKHLMSLSAGIFVISMAFVNNFFDSTEKVSDLLFLKLSWVFLIVSLIGGIFHLRFMDSFFLTYRLTPEEGNKKRENASKIITLFESIQIVAFIIGLVLILYFGIANI